MYGVCFGALMARLGPWSAALMSNMSSLFWSGPLCGQWAAAGSSWMQRSRPPIGDGGRKPKSRADAANSGPLQPLNLPAGGPTRTKVNGMNPQHPSCSLRRAPSSLSKIGNSAGGYGTKPTVLPRSRPFGLHRHSQPSGSAGRAWHGMAHLFMPGGGWPDGARQRLIRPGRSRPWPGL
jgi:hypothetical protein